MKFGRQPLSVCEGAILAHKLRLAKRVLKKGHVISAEDLKTIAAENIDSLIVALLDDDDMSEDAAALAISRMLETQRLEAVVAGTGRVNFHAACNGVFQVSRNLVDRINAVDPAITLATLAEFEPVLEGRMVATIKIIPYGVRAESISALATQAGAKQLMSVSPYKARKTGLVSTLLPGLKKATIEKTQKVLEQRLAASGSQIVAHERVAHDVNAVGAALETLLPSCDMLIVFGASAISDMGDVIPTGLLQSGGEVLHLGMPVDPGNLLMLGRLKGVPVIGAPGCARAPSRNGFDFVLERLLADLPIGGEDIAKMGVGGLLMEIGSRPQPREVLPETEARIGAVVLAAGRSSRMGSRNKLLIRVEGKAMVRHAVEACDNENVERCVVVTGHEATAVRNALADANATVVHNPDYAEGLSTSLAVGVNALGKDMTHALIMLGDMPLVDSEGIAALAETIRSEGGDRIIVATHDGKRGNPVIWPRAYFEALTQIGGDTGAKHLIGQHSDKVVEVELGQAASLDIDTPEALKRFLGSD